MKIKGSLIFNIFVLFFFMASNQASASILAMVNVHVIIGNPPPCIINGDNLIEINFGDDILTSKVDGVNYSQEVPYTLICSGQSSNQMTLEIIGMEASFDSNIMRTSNKDLGIGLIINGKLQALNSKVMFTYPDSPKIAVVPMKNSASKLSGGAFSAGATLRIQYQ